MVKESVVAFVAAVVASRAADFNYTVTVQTSDGTAVGKQDTYIDVRSMQSCTSIQNSTHHHSSFILYIHQYLAFVPVEVRKRTLYRKLILRKWRLKFPKDFNVDIDVVLDCLLYACKTFNGHSARLCFMCIRRCIE